MVIPYSRHAARNVAEATALSVALQLCTNQLEQVIADHAGEALDDAKPVASLHPQVETSQSARTM